LWQPRQRIRLFPKVSILLLLVINFLNLNAFPQGSKRAFKGGEMLKYQIYYGFINGGEAVLQVNELMYENKPAYHLYLNGRTVGIANTLYNVNDTYESYTDPATHWPYFSIRNIHEGRYRHYSTQVWDHWSRSDSSIVISSKTGKVVVVKGCQDILSSVYYLRNKMLTHPPLKPDQIITVDTYFTDEKYPLIVRFKGYETIKTRFGKVMCMKFMPVVITGRVFKTKDDMTIWFSNDANLVPIRVRFEIFVGSVYCDLIEYKGLANEFDSLVKKE